MSETDNATSAAGSKRDRGILLTGLITYGVGQSLLYIIFAPLGQKIGMPQPDKRRPQQRQPGGTVASMEHRPSQCKQITDVRLLAQSLDFDGLNRDSRRTQRIHYYRQVRSAALCSICGP